MGNKMRVPTLPFLKGGTPRSSAAGDFSCNSCDNPASSSPPPTLSQNTRGGWGTRTEEFSAADTKGRLLSRPFIQNRKRKLLLGRDGVLGCFGDAELHHRLGFDLDGFTGLRIASQAGLAMSLHQAAQSRDHEDAILLGLFNGDLGELLKKCCRRLIVALELLRQMADELCLGQT